MPTENNFIQSATRRFSDYKNLGEKTFEQLSETEMHYAPSEVCNNIAVIIQHLHGNMLSRWTNFLTEDGEKSWRDRDAEFEKKKLSQEELVTLWAEGWKVIFETLGSLTAEDLHKTITIRSEPHSVMDAIVRQIAHYSYHVGQIVLLGKLIKGTAWKTLSIAKKGSAAYNEKMMGKGFI